MRVFHRLKAIFRRRQLERDLEDEFSSHIKMDAQERMDRGQSAEDAYRSASREFGNRPRAAEDVRESWGAAGIDRFLQDVRYAFRQIKRNQGFVVVAVLTLGLGIGANTAIFSIVNAVLLKPLPYKDPDRLVRVVENVPAADSFSGAPERTTAMDLNVFLEWRSRTNTLAAMSMEKFVAMTLRGREPARLSGLQVTSALFPILGVQPALGRAFNEDEEKPGFDKSIILSYGAWQRLFAGDPKTLGATLILDDASYTVVGIMPKGFTYLDPQIEFWTPLALPANGLIGLPVIARLKDGVPLAAAAQEANVIGRYMRGETPGDPQPQGPPRIQLMTVKEEMVSRIRLPFLIFVIAVTFVLLIACVNIANLFLARATSRRGEIGIRMALGAGRGRLLRQLLMENFILASLGGVAGIAVAFAGIRIFSGLGQRLPRLDLIRLGLTGNAIPRLNEAGINVPVLLFTIAITVMTGFLFGLIPALQIRRTYPLQAISKNFVGSSPIGANLVRTIMVTGQISLTVILLLGAGLLIKSFLMLGNTKVGYDPSNVLTFRIPQPALDFPKDGQKQRRQNAFAEEVIQRLESTPGVQAAAFTNSLPMVQGYWGWVGPSQGPGKPQHEGRSTVVSPDYFRVMRINVIAGRGFNEDDLGGHRTVYVVNRAAIQEYFRGVNPVGKVIATFNGTDKGEIVGVVEDTRQSGPDEEPVPQIFMNPEHMNNSVWGEGYYFAVRTTLDAASIVPAIRGIVRDLDPNAPIDDIATMNQILSNSITTPRSYAVLLGTFSAAALALASIGLYGVLSYFVKQRTREIGIRVALGAERRSVIRFVMRQGLLMSFAGLSLGLIGGAALTKYLRAMLFQVTPLDRATFIAVSILFIAIALLASFIPARQATAIDPLTALRYE
jgi:putative ABC transport system permease protein